MTLRALSIVFAGEETRIRENYTTRQYGPGPSTKARQRAVLVRCRDPVSPASLIAQRRSI